jgi:hypothetical protein
MALVERISSSAAVTGEVVMFKNPRVVVGGDKVYIPPREKAKIKSK